MPHAVALPDLVAFRRHDDTGDLIDVEALHRRFMPKSFDELLAGLSNVTSVFYGLMLDTHAAAPGRDINDASVAFFHRLGMLKMGEILANETPEDPVPRDTRGAVLAVIAAIYTASPEYVFRLERLSPDLSVINLGGRDRYLRVAAALGIASRLQWPTLRPFFVGALERLGVDASVETRVTYTDGNGRMECTYRIRRP